MLAALALINALIFIPFFAPSLAVLLVGQLLIGLPWGVFQTLPTAYAAEVTPLHLRAYLTTYVNLCWVSHCGDLQGMTPTDSCCRFSASSAAQEFCEQCFSGRTNGLFGSRSLCNGYGQYPS